VPRDQQCWGQMQSIVHVRFVLSKSLTQSPIVSSYHHPSSPPRSNHVAPAAYEQVSGHSQPSGQHEDPIMLLAVQGQSPNKVRSAQSERPLFMHSGEPLRGSGSTRSMRCDHSAVHGSGFPWLGWCPNVPLLWVVPVANLACSLRHTARDEVLPDGSLACEHTPYNTTSCDAGLGQYSVLVGRL